MNTNKLGELIERKLDQMEIAAAIYFCILMQRGGTFQRVQYPTGLEMMQATHGTEKVEIHIPTCKIIRKSDWTIRN